MKEVFVVFCDESIDSVWETLEEAEDFRRALNSPSKLAVAIKMEVNNKNILLLPVKEAVNAYLKGISG